MKMVSRRTFLRLCLLAGGSSGLAWGKRVQAAPLNEPGASPSGQPLVMKKVYLPWVANPNVSLSGRVAHVHSSQATNWTGQPHWWEYAAQTKIDQMVDQGMLALTGAAELSSAWRFILPNYQPGQKIAIKVNFNNCSGCSDSDTQIDASIQPVNAVVRGLKLVGVPEAAICVYDAARPIPARFTAGCLYPGVMFYSSGACQKLATFSSNASGSAIQFNPPAGAPNPGKIKVTDVLVNTDYLINMPIMKNHVLAGVTLSFKHHFGSTNNPSGMHANVSQGWTGYRSDYNALIDLYKNPHIGAKTILILADGLFASKTLQSGSPSLWNSFNGQLPNSLFFATDPVAVDSVMCDYLAAEVALTPGHDDYLKLANQAGLGVYERGDPRGSGYHSIRYSRLEI